LRGRIVRVEVLDPPSKGLQGDVPRNRLRPEWSNWRAWIAPGQLLIALAAVVFLLMLGLWLKRAGRGIRQVPVL
jgi:hypothetical protein